MPAGNYATLWLVLALKPGLKVNSRGKALSPWETPGWFERFKLGDLPANSHSKTVGLSKPEDVADFVSALSNLPEGNRANFILSGGDCGAGRAAYKGWFRFISKATNDLIDQIMLANNAHPQQVMAIDNNNEWPDFTQLVHRVSFEVTEGLYDDAFLRGFSQVNSEVVSTIRTFVIYTGTRLKKTWSRMNPLYEELKANLILCVAGKRSIFWVRNRSLSIHRANRERCNNPSECAKGSQGCGSAKGGGRLDASIS